MWQEWNGEMEILVASSGQRKMDKSGLARSDSGGSTEVMGSLHGSDLADGYLAPFGGGRRVCMSSGSKVVDCWKMKVAIRVVSEDDDE
uniref:Uncharacterized protein n=1 Tax=Cannabis sativa TaxID=3483 RepID=A0A803P6N6_CANSA